MRAEEFRYAFLDFFQERGHKVVPSSSLLPVDQSVLFTTAGMQQLSSYLEGKEDPIKKFGTRHLCSCQKCFRSDDIEEIGDDTHHTFFEMLGNWSIGQDEKGSYFKEGAIKSALEFLTDILKLDKNRFYITIFQGNKEIPRDNEAERIWLEQGIAKEKIKEFGEKDNLWGPVGETGICGPCSEIHYDRGEKFGCGRKNCGPNCPHCQRFVELWNLVFIQYYKDENGNYQKLPQKSVDTGMGFERVLAVLQNKPSAYETDLFLPIIQEIEKKSPTSYKLQVTSYRILADHIRAIPFLISEGILPSNLGRGYVLRRLLRRIIRHSKILNLPKNWYVEPLKKVIEIYKLTYPELKNKENDAITVFQNEEEKFGKSLERGLIQFEELANSKLRTPNSKIRGEEAFDLYQTYGFPLEMTKELAKEKGLEVDEPGFYEAMRKHQEISRAGKEKKFGGVGEKATYQATKLHTATHLLHAALREVLGKEVRQMGSDINEERLRFDFSFSRKLTEKEIKEIEDLVNQKIKEDLEVKREEMKLDEAVKSGALSFFREKYPEVVSVYTIFNPKTGEVFSKEICAGPHVNRTSELGEFKVIKEESSSAGVRRIKATLRITNINQLRINPTNF